MKAALVTCTIVLATSSVPECGPPEPEPSAPARLLLGQPTNASITGTDHQCHSIDPCRAFDAPVPHTGQLTVSLLWPDKESGLRLEVWNGEAGESMCCDPGEDVSISSAAGDTVVVRVILVRQPASGRQKFELKAGVAPPTDGRNHRQRASDSET